jgi:hypothetical protein
MTKTCSNNCRFCSLKFQKVRKGTNKYGGDTFDVITRYHCSYQKVTHANSQDNCQDFLGQQTIFEYLMYKQPDTVHQLLSRMGLRVVGSRNKWGFDIK